MVAGDVLEVIKVRDLGALQVLLLLLKLLLARLRQPRRCQLLLELGEVGAEVELVGLVRLVGELARGPEVDRPPKLELAERVAPAGRAQTDRTDTERNRTER